MGNCVGPSSNKEQEAEMELAQPITFAPTVSELDRDPKQKNRVRFRLQEDHGEEDDIQGRNNVGVVNRNDKEHSKSNVVRIRMVVTIEELKQILDNKTSDFKFSSVEQLLSELKLRGRSVLEVERKNANEGNWIPKLECIQEDN